MTTKLIYEVEKQVAKAKREGRFFTRLKGAELMRDMFGYRIAVEVVDWFDPWEPDDNGKLTIGYIVTRQEQRKECVIYEYYIVYSVSVGVLYSTIHNHILSVS